MRERSKVEGLAKEPAMDEDELQVGQISPRFLPAAGQLAASQAVFHRGLEQRAVAAHAMNAESSRSHVLFTVGGTQWGWWSSRPDMSTCMQFIYI